MTIPLWVGILLLFAGGVLGFMSACFCFACRRGDDMIKEIQDKDERAEELIEIFLENADCDHDVGPNEHHVSYNISKIGKEKILEVL